MWSHSERQSLSTPSPAIMSLLLPMILLVSPVVTTSSLQGSFCQSHYPRLGCCQGRRDLCGVNILNTTCYCDTFCVRSEKSVFIKSDEFL